ncbi:MAG: Gldg family protein [Candidatus Cloacimonadota bacterium]|nr:Gldg family protein [Candidatus Cloacimonadota bacterium]
MKKIKNTSITNLIIFIVIIFVINMISINLFFRLDFSDGKIYSLSEASKNTIQYLNGRMIIKAYFSEDLPPQLADVKRYTKDILTEYKIASKGKIRFEFVSSADKIKFKKEAQENQIPPVNVNVQENDKMEVREAYLGLAFIYEDKTAQIPLVKKTRGLEYEITRTIKQISIANLPQIAFYNPGSFDQQNSQMRKMFGMPTSEYGDIIDLLKESYDVQEVDFTENIDDFGEVVTLIVPAIDDSLSQDQLWLLDQLIMRGKNTIFMQETVSADLQNQQASLKKSNVIDLLNHYGLRMKNNLVLDETCGQINIQEKRGIFSVRTPMKYPFFPILNNMNRSHPIVKNLENIQMVFASEIDTTTLTNLDFTPLLYSSENSGTMEGRFNIGINQFKDNSYYGMLNKSNRILAGIYEGEFSSYFAGGYKSDSGNFRHNSSKTKLILVSDGDLVKSSAGGRVPGNQNFIINSVDFLANNADLISLRSRSVSHRPLNLKKVINVEGLTPDRMESKLNKTRRTIKWINILMPVILLMLFGLWNYRKEKKLRERLKDIYE